MIETRAVAAFALSCALLGASCAPGPSGTGATTDTPATPKTIRLTMPATAEPRSGFSLVGGTGIFPAEHQLTFHAGLTAHDTELNLTGKLAERVPTVENGDWRLRPDSTMEVIWRLRRDVTWHDGTPLAAEDFVFGYTLRVDPELGISGSVPTNLISEVAAPDPHTFVVRWKQAYFLANQSTYHDFGAVPRHILQPLYQQGDKRAVINSEYWTREFVGLGPYQVGEWVSGSTLEGIAYDRYFLGKPRIDRVIFQYFGSPETQIASLLGGGSDLAPLGSGLHSEGTMLIKNAWELTGLGTVLQVPAGVWFYHLQHRDKSLPWGSDASVRRALVHGIDRQTNVDELKYGLVSVAHTFVTVDDPIYKLLEQRGLSRYPYDPTKARQLLTEAGWSPGPDGVLQKGGQRFTITLLARNEAGTPEEAQAIASQLTGIGIAATMVPFAPGAAGASEIAAKNPGTYGLPWYFGPTAFQNFTSARISSEENRWSGSNVSGHSSPMIDQLFERYQVTLPAGERAGLAADMLKIAADDVARIPLYYRMNPAMFRKGIRGPGRAPAIDKETASTWNIHTWEMD